MSLQHHFAQFIKKQRTLQSNIEKLPRDIQGEKSRNDTVTSEKFVSKIRVQASPQNDGIKKVFGYYFGGTTEV